MREVIDQLDCRFGDMVCSLQTGYIHVQLVVDKTGEMLSCDGAFRI